MMVLEPQTRIAIKNILFATDFSPCSDAALRYARDIARLYGSHVIVAHVFTPVPFQPEAGISVDPVQIEERLRHELDQVASLFHEVPHRAVMLSGEIAAALAWTAKKEAVDLIVLGTHGRTGLSRLVMGSVAEEVFRQAKCPVLTVGPHTVRHPLAHRVQRLGASVVKIESNIRTVLYATDFSQESLAAAPFAVSMAQEHEAKLVLLHTVEGAGDDYAKEPARVLSHLVAELKRLLPEDASLWCEPEFLVDFGDPSKRILEIAADLQADLIVMGVRSARNHLTTVTHMRDTTAHKVLAGATCPVLTVMGSQARRVIAGA